MNNIRKKLFEIIFEADTKTGKIFNISLLTIIVISVVVVLLESVPQIRKDFGNILHIIEWIITIIFTIEYILRISITKAKLKYITSFYGIVDLLSVLPSYMITFITGAQSLLVIRAIRLLRIFRILKISRYTSAGQTLTKAIVNSRAKIGVFLFSVFTIVLIIGTLMYLIEGEKNGFISIPKSIYWAIVTLTTVGYGDLTPQTTLGQFLSGMVMILGYAIIAVPTGIISVEISKTKTNTQICPECLYSQHDNDAVYCKKCGSEINP